MSRSGLKFVSSRGRDVRESRSASSSKGDRIKTKGVNDFTSTESSGDNSASITYINLAQFATLIGDLHTHRMHQITDLPTEIKEKYMAVEFILSGNINADQKHAVEKIIDDKFASMTDEQIIAGSLAAAFVGCRKKSSCLAVSGCTPHCAGSLIYNQEATGYQECDHSVFILKKTNETQVMTRLHSKKSNKCYLYLFDGITKVSDNVIQSLTKEYGMTFAKIFKVTEGVNSKCEPLNENNDFINIAKSTNDNNHDNHDHPVPSNNEKWSWFSIITILLIVLIIGFMIYYIIKPSYFTTSYSRSKNYGRKLHKKSHRE